MKIVDRVTFLTLPTGTVYAKGEPWVFGSLSIKDDSIPADASFCGDWFYLDPAWIDADTSEVAFERLDEMQAKGTSYPMETAVGRDGLFDQKDIFLVFERDDLLKLRGMIDTAIAVAGPALVE